MSVPWPILVKGVLLVGGKVLLLRNERGELELPGGRLEIGESPEKCLLRKIHGETQLSCVISTPPVDAWVFEGLPGREVFIVTYHCKCFDLSLLRVSDEHQEYSLISLGELDRKDLPEGYRRGILRAAKLETG
ncbi:NUDIX domain-containing protein [Marininema mesophilum]|uniref:NUDIX domain-containing protein n=1 Tax=Marininema mesophilum TaxID=1048340 RepID=UPI000B84ABF6|nr:NUDIX hydrolase [Marininema mesophilum]